MSNACFENTKFTSLDSKGVENSYKYYICVFLNYGGVKIHFKSCIRHINVMYSYL
jgi:hypothetical protein